MNIIEYMTMISCWSCGTMGTWFSAEAIVPKCATSHWLQMLAKDSRLSQSTSRLHQNDPNWVPSINIQTISFMIHTSTESHYPHPHQYTAIPAILATMVTTVATPAFRPLAKDQAYRAVQSITEGTSRRLDDQAKDLFNARFNFNFATVQSKT